MSDFQLDVDSPYARPTRQDLIVKPKPLQYSQGRIPYKHYGKYVGAIIRKLAETNNPEAVSRKVDNIARYMRSKSFEYNQEHPNNEVIIKDIKQMSDGNIVLDEVALNNLRSGYKNTFTARPQKSNGKQRPQKHQKSGFTKFQKNAHHRVPNKQ